MPSPSFNAGRPAETALRLYLLSNLFRLVSHQSTRSNLVPAAPLGYCGREIPFDLAVYFYRPPVDTMPRDVFLRTVLHDQITGSARMMRAWIAELYLYRNAFEVDGEALRWSG